MEELNFLTLIVTDKKVEKYIEAKKKGHVQHLITFEPEFAEFVEKNKERLDFLEVVGTKKIGNDECLLVRTTLENAIVLCSEGLCKIDEDYLVENIKDHFNFSIKNFLEIFKKKIEELKRKSVKVDIDTILPPRILEKMEEKLKTLKKEIIEKEEKEKGFFKTKLSNITADLIWRKVKFTAQIVGYSVGKAIERKVLVKCSKCGEVFEEKNLEKEENYRFFYLAIKNKEALLRELKNFAAPLPCIDEKSHRLFIEFDKTACFDYSILQVRELPENIQAFSENEFFSLASKTWQVLYKGVVDDVKVVEITGYVVKSPKTNEIEIVAYDIKPIEEEFVAKKFTKEEHEIFKKYFNEENLERIKKYQIAPWIVNRDFAKLSALLVLHSPYKIPSIGKEVIRGSLRAIWFGDTKTGKSDMGTDITFGHFKIGEYCVGESSSRTGLLYSIDTENKMIVWGILPLNDRKFVFLDGIHTIPSQQAKEFRESLEQERVKVERMVRGIRNARVRIIATFNPNSEMREYWYKIVALKDVEFFRNPPDITRWDIFIPFSQEDVNPEEIAKARSQVESRPIPDNIFRAHVYWAWSLEPYQITYLEEAKNLIVQCSTEIMKEYASPSIPIVHNGFVDVLTRIAVAFAVLLHSVEFNESGKELVVVKPKHVMMAKDFIENMIEILQYDAYLVYNREMEKISDKEAENIVKDLKEKHLELLNLLKMGPKSSKDLAIYFGVTERTIKEWYVALKKHNLIETSPGFGIRLTKKGKYVLKYIENSKNRKNDKEIEEIAEPGFGMCEFCGKEKLLKYRNQDNQLMCEECYREEKLRQTIKFPSIY